MLDDWFDFCGVLVLIIRFGASLLFGGFGGYGVGYLGIGVCCWLGLRLSVYCVGLWFT